MMSQQRSLRRCMTEPMRRPPPDARTGGGRRSRVEQLLDGEQLNVYSSGSVVPQPHPPRAAAHLAILDVLLRPPASGIERDGHRLATVGAGHVGLGLEGRRVLL